MNDDVQEVRRLLAPANPVARDDVAGAGQDATGRAAFARVTASAPEAPARRRGSMPRRTGVRLVAVGGLAVAVAGGVTVVQNAGGTDGSGRTRSAVPGLPGAPAADAQVVLAGAASAVRSRPFTAPRPSQWVYVETSYRRAGVPAKGQVRTPDEPLKKTVERIWTRADGKRMAFMEKGRLVNSPSGGGMPPTDYAGVAALPRDPAALLAWARKEPAPLPKGDAAFKLLSSLLSNNGVLPPAQEASVYGAIAKIPGVRLDRRALDALGRPALGLSFVMEGYFKDEILLDPVKYTYRGHRTTILKDHTFPEGGTFKKGVVESTSARLETGVVDRPGQRP